MSCGRSCAGGVHVSGMTYLAMCYFYWKKFLLDDMFCLMACVIGGYVLQFYVFYWSMFYRRINLTG